MKVIIDGNDLAERGVNFLDLIGDPGRIESFFYSILEEVDEDYHFQESETVTFQVIPNGKGLELYISRASQEEMSEMWRTQFKQHQQHDNDKHTAKENDDDIEKIAEMLIESVESDSEQLDNELDEPEIISFKSIEDFLTLAKELPTHYIASSLYYMNERYFLVLGDILDGIDEEIVYNQFVAMLEYGESHATTEAILSEYGELIRENDALVFFGKNFK